MLIVCPFPLLVNQAKESRRMSAQLVAELVKLEETHALFCSELAGSRSRTRTSDTVTPEAARRDGPADGGSGGGGGGNEGGG
mmetsp:Transcript_18097/g.42070  ORF Transcript_18097/g.42070 Transcript_18097/m.42070 type:complete len:82 (-) Transcript_18097:465-710(-)